MNLEFQNQSGDTFSLGSCSFGYLDRKDIFDDYDEDDDYYSDLIIVITGKKKIQDLKEDIENLLERKEPLRKDLREKILKFCRFLYESDRIVAELK